ncbi:head completion/stabilization protein [Xenorhabdus griffiniae]|uniref:Head completion/stabilization protein n=1 Tax=Xenorhabdus griffiniae TaxID=351672 RepID=A0ABY9XKX0_9GAMM|nr:head completion/stabilization protein [Xenorhabdus griffiniae]MBD1229319.1 head completion/stabilization protein [Xenorhabdus griffiniae]MBE8588454.1 head completion/stabilization protein [Xenorhabdus griffiniae]WMV73592.1 head completion/stabilization protein [Xenorhabdus griffiniae]WNH03272.1 head completion/stabilization protein [Xenorhabdus griffiniae]
MFNGNTVDYRDAPLTNDGFWPDLNLREFQEHRKLPADLDNDMLANALLATVAEINLALMVLKMRLKLQGYSTAAEVPGVSINGQTAIVSQYKKAVYARAKADLLGEYTSLVSRAPNPGQESPEVRTRLLAEAAVVLRNMKGHKRVTVRSI